MLREVDIFRILELYYLDAISEQCGFEVDREELRKWAGLYLAAKGPGYLHDIMYKKQLFIAGMAEMTEAFIASKARVSEPAAGGSGR